MELGKNKLCFIVDDDHFSRRALNNILTKMGYDTIEITDGTEAFVLMESQKPDIIFLDWNMPVMDGLQFLKMANETEYREDIKIIFLTSETSNEKVIEAMDENPDDYLMKPFSKSKIESSLHTLGV